MEKYWKIQNKKDTKDIGELYLYGDISNYKFWDEDITPQEIEKELKNLGNLKELNVYINSGGGSVFAGMAIHNIIKRNKAEIKNVHIDGLSASIATVIMLAGDFIYAPMNSMIMIHNPSAFVWGDVQDMEKMVETLNTIKDNILNVYHDRTGLDKDELSKMMDEETWMTSQKAVELGFCDECTNDEVENTLSDTYLMSNNIKFQKEKIRNENSFLNCLTGIKYKNESDNDDEKNDKKDDIIKNNKRIYDLKLKIYKEV